MKVKTFQGRTMAETLGQVKRLFGPHAVILNTRSLTKGGWFGMGGKPYVEITAAKGPDALPEPLRRGTVPIRSGRTDPADGAARAVKSNPPSRGANSPDAVLEELGALKGLVHELVRQGRSADLPKQPGKLYEAYLKLVENAVAEELAADLVKDLAARLTASQLRSAKTVRGELIKLVNSMVPTAGPIRLTPGNGPTVVALVGPTGVGKTTTIAKLAANLLLRENRKVGLITIDSYRIAAVEQLRTYARIIDVPLEVAMSPPELKQAVGRLADRDCILIDTAGRSQRDEMKVKELRGFFTAVKPHEVHLVLAGVSSEKTLLDTIERFKEIGIDRLIFTKLDEAVGFGVMLKCLRKAEARLSYVTAGQDVPDDIEVGRPERLAQLVLGESRMEAVGLPAT